jgi:prepilin-type N-terminal cleavage/methylation domain-containing protein
MNTDNRTRKNQGFTIVELIVVVTVIGLLAVIAVGAYNKVVNDAKIAKSTDLISTLSKAKSLFVSDSKTTSAMLTQYNGAPDTNFNLLAPFIRINGAQPADQGQLLSLSGMPASVQITLGTIDDTSFGGAHTDQAPTVTGYGL